MGLKRKEINLFTAGVNNPGAAAIVQKPLDMLPDRIGGQPAYLCGILVKYAGTLTGAAGTEDASQRELAASLGTIQLQGGGWTPFEALRGDLVLYHQYQERYGTTRNPGDWGVIQPHENIAADEGEAASHTVYLPAMSRNAGRGMVDRSGVPWYEGALDARVAAEYLSLRLHGVGQAPVGDVEWSNITITVDAVMAYGDPGETLAPIDLRVRHLGPVDENNETYRLGGLYAISSLGVISDDIPSYGDDSRDLAIKTASSQYEVRVDDITVLETLGYMIPRLRQIDTGGRSADDPDAMSEAGTQCELIAPGANTKASERATGSQIVLSGWQNESESSLCVLCAYGEPTSNQLARVREETGADTTRPRIGDRPAGDAGLGASEAAGVQVRYPTPGKRS